ncbi:hypothetical protein P153DRAFT_397649 [Dothidotthia symphoricarpi CBS 119687]|uniref:Uncharacterized protein n=1 Tax=Dothidotthia symphoricarpi CBS 119687 TaxID=1392245 RepID=A0A6A6ABK5_9PLEO|nr:uncharacterized protein P153DRAFT_397649 [Dothidotthia symphoricarpi CBS 119687]KAF2128593.1 hypothetical protein P153DRAFT_397649 [Dothidotthia symphoricarpi CBS 119687]
MSYHHNKLNMVGLDDDSDYDYKPATKSSRKGVRNTPKSMTSSTAVQKPTSISNGLKRKRGSKNNTPTKPTKPTKRSNIAVNKSLVPHSINFGNTSEDVMNAGAQFMTPFGNNLNQFNFNDGYFNGDGIAGFTNTPANNHSNMLINDFSGGFGVGTAIGAAMNNDIDAIINNSPSTRTNNTTATYMDTGLGSSMYGHHGFDFGYGAFPADFGIGGLDFNSHTIDDGHGLSTIDPNQLNVFESSQEHHAKEDGAHDALEDDQMSFDGDTNPLIKEEQASRDNVVSSSPAFDSEYEGSDSDRERPSKTPKINKDGAPRKPRQPRPKLLKWKDDDWKNVALGIVWACGENRIPIPFDQAAQIVSDQCTAGALQQALLKLRGKQIAEGYQIPPLKMAWTRKNKTSALSNADFKKAQDDTTTRSFLSRRTSTLMRGTQSLIVVLKRPYKEADRVHLIAPFRWVERVVQMISPGRAADDWEIVNAEQEALAMYPPRPTTPSNSTIAEGHVAASLNSAGMPQGNGSIAFSNGAGDMSRVSWEHLRQLEGDDVMAASLEDFIYDDIFL